MKYRSDKGRAARNNARFYTGRTTVTSGDSAKLKKQKEYRRRKLSKQKRDELLQKARIYLRWGIVATVLLIMLNSMIMRSSSLNGLSAASDADRNVVASLTNDYLSGFRRFKPLFNSSEYQEYVRENAPFVRSAEANIPLFSTTLSVEVVTKMPAFAYANSALGSPDTNYWLAQDGTLITLTDSQVAALSTEVSGIVVTDNSGIPFTVGELVIPEDEIEYMSAFALEMQFEEDVEVTGYRIGEQPRQVRAEIKSQPYVIILSTERTLSNTLGDYRQAIATLRANNTSVAQYIDLRIADKIFYR